MKTAVVTTAKLIFDSQDSHIHKHSLPSYSGILHTHTQLIQPKSKLPLSLSFSATLISYSSRANRLLLSFSFSADLYIYKLCNLPGLFMIGVCLRDWPGRSADVENCALAIGRHARAHTHASLSLATKESAKITFAASERAHRGKSQQWWRWWPLKLDFLRLPLSLSLSFSLSLGLNNKRL